MRRILFIASLHHPEQLLADRQRGIDALFPTSMRQHFWERAMRAQGYTLDVFWRNLSGFGARTIEGLSAETFTQGWTPQRIAQAISGRLPYALNPDLQRRNALLIDHARQFQPDVLWLIGDNRVIHASTLATIKAETGCKLLYSTGTSPIVFSHALEREAAALYDLVLTNDYYHGIQWRELGAQAMLCLPATAIDPDFHYPHPLTDEQRATFACDVTFVGTLLPRHLYGERVEALLALREYDLGIWSVHHLPPELEPFGRGAALGPSMLDVLSGATISLNPHGNFMRYGGNMRLFEAAGVGAFQLVDDRPGVHEWFTPDEHLVIYRDLDDLRAKVAYYLAHPDERAAIAAAARQHVLDHHTYQHRLAALEASGFFDA